MAIINSNSEDKLLLGILEENKVEQAWLGVHDLYEEGDWNTVLDEALEATGFSKWAVIDGTQMPNNYNNEQHCGGLSIQGGLNDIICTDELSFFCEITI